MMPGMKYISAAAVMCLLLANAASANLPALSQEIIEQQQKARLEQAQQQREALLTPQNIPLLPAIADKDSGSCQYITRIKFIRANSLSEKDKAALVRPFVGRCLTMSNIMQLQRAATNRYIQRGFITSHIWLSPQDLTHGTLALTASEGRVESITLGGDRPLMLNSAFPHLIGRVLNLRDLEQGLEQLNRLRSQQVTIDIQPGTRAGYSAVVLHRDNSRLPLQAELGIDNSGQKSTGRGQLNASASLDNLLRLADRWLISASHNSDFASSYHSRAVNGALTLPWGWWLLSVQGGWSEQLQTIHARSGSWDYRGKSVSQGLNLSRMLWRNDRSRLAADVGLNHRRITNRLAGEKLHVSSPRLSVLQLGASFSTQLAGGYLTSNPQVDRGIVLSAEGKGAAQAQGGPRRTFTKYSLNTSYLYPLSERLSWLTSAYGQATADNLHASERLSVCGQYSVRGYKDRYLSGNRGLYWRNELNWQLGSLPSVGSISITAALDGGWLDGERGNISGGKLGGSALGIAAEGRGFSQSLSAAKPLAHPRGLHPDSWVMYWQVGVRL